jgi:NADPH-dependent glutamate synthase beta subunit-like oxidoreductase/NAD-dependent dihydropyrimidine dehydrogenase PreA subunit
MATAPRRDTPHPAPRGHRLLIAGAGPDAVRLALALADAGLPVTVATRGVLSPAAGGALGSSLYDEIPLQVALLNHPMAEVLEGTEVEALASRGEGLEATLRRRAQAVDPARCTACGKCVPVCPVELPGERGGPARRAVGLPPADAGPGVARIEKAGRAPCRTACPIGVNAQGYVALVARGRYREALALVRERNPLPGVCGRVCTHPCEAACRRAEVDEPVAICRLKRFVADLELADSIPFAWEPPAAERPEPVAVVGSGPAGLTAAYDLRRRGYPVTVFEALPLPGGLLRSGIPAYRLPREILDYEIGLIAAMGVRFRTGVAVGRDLAVDALLAQGFRAVVLATGAPRDRRMGVPGEALGGVTGSLAFLRRSNLGEPVEIGARVAVVGGGNSAIDAARTALRRGAEEVTVVYRRGEEEMPALPEEVAAAREEGVAFRFLTAPVEILGAEGRATALHCVSMALGAPDASGRRRPEPVPGTEHEIAADTIILAIGQEGDAAVLAGTEGVAVNAGRIAVDLHQATARPGVFAAGDAVRGPENVIWAMAEGQRTALAVHAWLSGESVAWPDWSRTDYDRRRPLPEGIPRAARVAVPHAPAAERRRGFAEAEGPLREAEAVAEAARCLQCGVCCECGECVTACGDAAAIDHSRVAETVVLPLLAAVRTGADEELGVGARHLLFDAREPGRDGEGPPTADAVLARFGEDRHEPHAGRRRASEDRGRVGVFLCTCNGSVHHSSVLALLAEEAAGLPGVAGVEVLNAACQADGALRMAAGLRGGRFDRVLLAACLCCPLEIVCGSCTHQRARAKRQLFDGLEVPLQRLEAVNLRDEVLNQPGLGPARARDLALRLLRAGLARATAGAAEPPGEAAAAQPGPDRGHPAPLPLPGRVLAGAGIDAGRCRGCGTCVANCPQEAIALLPREGGVDLAVVDAAACTLCGRCLAVCPTGAPEAPFAGHRQIQEALAAALGGAQP